MYTVETLWVSFLYLEGVFSAPLCILHTYGAENVTSCTNHGYVSISLEVHISSYVLDENLIMV